MRAGIYARVSLDPKGESKSVEQQVAESRAWCEREGWDVAEVVEETGSASRYARTPRERWGEVVELIESRRIDVLVTWESSRATRDLAVYAVLRDLCARHGVLWAYSGTAYDLSRREDRFRTGMDALLAEDESARISERVQRATRARAAAGAPHGRIPYGYRREYDEHRRPHQLPDETTAPVIRRMYADVVAGKPLYAIAKALNDEEVPTPRPTKRGWYSVTIRNMVLSPAYAAKRVHQGKVIGPAAWPALVDDDTWQAAVVILTAPDRPRRPDSTTKHLLSGIARCGVCGSNLYVGKPRGRLSYWCAAGHHVARSKALLEPHVIDRLLALLELRADLAHPDDRPATAEAAAELHALQTRLTTFADAAAAGELTAASLARIEARLLPDIDKAERRLRTLRTPSALAGLDLSTPTASWPTWSIDTQRSVLRETVEVVVHRTRRGVRGRIDPDGVTITPGW